MHIPGPEPGRESGAVLAQFSRSSRTGGSFSQAMIYCPNIACAKPKNTFQASFCSHCGTPLLLAQRFLLTQRLENSGRLFLAEDHHSPSRAQRVLVQLEAASGWSEPALQALEQLGQAGHLPAIVAVIACPGAPGAPPSQERWLAHTWIDGQTLAQRVEAEGCLGELFVRYKLRSLLEDLLQIHDQGFVHGDIRPQTLVERSRDRRPMAVSYRAIAPTGLAEALERPLRSTPDFKQLHYWAPEQRLGHALPASDLYSLGVTAIELLTGQSPETLFDVAEDRWCWETCLTQEVSAGFKAVLNGLLERAIRRRYSSALEVLEDLADLDELSVGLSGPSTAEESAVANSVANSALVELISASQGDRLEQTLMMDTLSSLAERNQVAPPPPDPHSNRPSAATNEEILEETLNLERSGPSLGEIAPGDPPATSTQQVALEPAIDDSIAFGLDPEAGAIADVAPDLQPEDSQRTPQKGPTAWVAAVLKNPLRLPLARLVQQLARGYTVRGMDYAPWEIARSLEQLKRTGSQPATFAATLIELGNFYRDQIRQGHRRLEHLVIAVAAYEQALRHLSMEDDPWASLCDDLGRVYLDLSRQHPAHRFACLEQAVTTYDRGLAGITQTQHPYFLILNNHLGEACGILAGCKDPERYWQRAIAAYETALEHCPAPPSEGGDKFQSILSEPEILWGTLQNNLGTALWNLSQQSDSAESSALLQRAIAAYNSALAYHDPEGDSRSYGMIQNNLGTAYLNLAQRENSLDLLRLAAGTYQVALVYRQRTEQPLAHAATQHNLGATSLQLASHPYADPQTQREALTQGVVACDAALALVRELANLGITHFGFDPTATELNLGIAHQRLGSLETGLENSNVTFAHLETAVQRYLSLLNRLERGHEIYELALGNLSQALHFLCEKLSIDQEHPLLQQVPNHLLVEMSQQFQRQLQQAS